MHLQIYSNYMSKSLVVHPNLPKSKIKFTIFYGNQFPFLIMAITWSLNGLMALFIASFQVNRLSLMIVTSYIVSSFQFPWVGLSLQLDLHISIVCIAGSTPNKAFGTALYLFMFWYENPIVLVHYILLIFTIILYAHITLIHKSPRISRICC